jgi:hypothetical protein
MRSGTVSQTIKAEPSAGGLHLLIRPLSGTIRSVTGLKTRTSISCRCEELERLDGEDAEAYASQHLTLIERGRNNYEMYQCGLTASSWIMDFPLGHWAPDRRGRAHLRREPFDEAALPIGALDLAP